MGKRILGPSVLVVFTTLVGAIALLGASLIYAAPVHAQSVADVDVTPGPTQTNPIIATYPPQLGFDPFTATDSELRTHGYPRRPHAGAALAAWQTAMSRATHYVSPDLIPCSCTFGPAMSSRASWSGTYLYSGNWAGHIMPQAALGNPNLTYSWAEWTVPAVPSDANFSNDDYAGAPGAAFWTGTGVQQLVQAGTDSISTSTPQYLFWVDDAPQNAWWDVGPNGLLPTSPGDTVGVSTQYSGALCNNCGGTATFWLEDLTTSNYTSFSISAPYPGWRAADFINEMHNDYYLPDFGSSVFTDCLTEDNSDDIWYLVTSNNDRMYMTTTGTSSGTVMSDPGAADNYTNGFTDTWKNQGP